MPAAFGDPAYAPGRGVASGPQDREASAEGGPLQEALRSACFSIPVVTRALAAVRAEHKRAGRARRRRVHAQAFRPALKAHRLPAPGGAIYGPAGRKRRPGRSVRGAPTAPLRSEAHRVRRQPPPWRAPRASAAAPECLCQGQALSEAERMGARRRCGPVGRVRIDEEDYPKLTTLSDSAPVPGRQDRCRPVVTAPRVARRCSPLVRGRSRRGTTSRAPVLVPRAKTSRASSIRSSPRLWGTGCCRGRMSEPRPLQQPRGGRNSRLTGEGGVRPLHARRQV